MWLKLFAWTVILLSLLAGVWGLYMRLMVGEESLALGSYMVWGLWVAMYIFFMGNAAGMAFMASLDLTFRIRLFAGLGRLFVLASLISLMAGLLHIGLDVGHPLRVWRFFLTPNFSSLMTQIVWLYSIFGAITLLLLITLFLPGNRVPVSREHAIKILSILSALVGLASTGAVGALLGVQAARPFWHVGLFPVQFPIFALASGAALALVLVAIFGDRKSQEYHRVITTLAVATIVFQFVKLYFLWADLSQSVYSGIPDNVFAVEALIFGKYWYGFWILQMMIGSVIPLIVLFQKRLRQNWFWVATAGVCILVGFAVARFNFILPALAVPAMEAIEQAYVDPRLTFNYFPSLAEWAYITGVTGFATALFYIVAGRLRLVGLGNQGK